MLFPSFGQELAQELVPIKKLMAAMRSADKKTLSSIESQLLLRDLYDNTFQIASHEDARRPMSLVAMQPKETFGPYSRQYRLYRRFAALGVGDLFKLSITEFLQQPREMVELMFQIAEDKTVVEERRNAQINSSLEAAMKGADK